jgi:hypothetical protein
MQDDFIARAREVGRPLRQRNFPQEIAPLGPVYSKADVFMLKAQEHRFTGIVLEPGHYERSPIENAYAYVPLSGFNTQNPSHAAWIEELRKVDGFLLDASGHQITDPNGLNTMMIDWRKSEVLNIMTDYLHSLRQKGYQHFFFDAIDSVSSLEYHQPRLQGISQHATNFIVSSGKGNVVNGGLFNAQGFDILPIIAKAGYSIAIESALSDGQGNTRSAADKEWLRARIATYSNAAGTNATVHFIEHTPLQQRTVMRSHVKELLPDEGVNFSLYVTPDNSYRALVPQNPAVTQPQRGQRR